MTAPDSQKRHKRRRMLFINVQKDKTSAGARTCGAEHTAIVPHCGRRMESKVCSLGRWIRPVDADHNRGRLWTFSTGTQSSCRYEVAEATAWTNFDTGELCEIHAINDEYHTRGTAEKDTLHARHFRIQGLLTVLPQTS